MNEESQPRKRGRPQKAKAERKDGNLTFRTRDGLREQLAAAAKISGRSISEEIERRLERSFDRELEILRQAVLGAPHTEQLLRRLARAAKMIEDWHLRENPDQPAAWSDIEILRTAMRQAAKRIVLDATPHREPLSPIEQIESQILGGSDPLYDAQTVGDLVGCMVLGDIRRSVVDQMGALETWKLNGHEKTSKSE